MRDNLVCMGVFVFHVNFGRKIKHNVCALQYLSKKNC